MTMLEHLLMILGIVNALNVHIEDLLSKDDLKAAHFAELFKRKTAMGVIKESSKDIRMNGDYREYIVGRSPDEATLTAYYDVLSAALGDEWEVTWSPYSDCENYLLTRKKEKGDQT